MFPRLRRQLLAIALLALSSAALADCPNGTMAVSDWNHMFDGTTMDISGCLIRVKEPISEPGPEDQQGTILPKADTPIPDTPSGWSAPVPPSTQPTPPSSYSSPPQFRGGSLQTACETNPTIVAGNGVITSIVLSPDGTYGTCNFRYNGVGSIYQQTEYKQTYCNSGYSVSSGTCTLTNPTAVVKPVDGKCNIIRSGNSFSGDPKDPDCGSPFYTAGKIEISGNTVKVKTEPSLTVKANTDGSTTISTTTINNTNNTTTISTANFNNAGLQTGRKTETFNGVGDSQNQVSSDAPFDVTSLNKEATQQAIKTGIDNLNTKLNAPEDTSLQSEKDAYNTTADAHRAKIEQIGNDGLDSHGVSWSWFPEIPSGTCSPVQYGVPGHMATWDICPTVNMLKDIFGFVLYIATAFGLFAILTGRKET